MNRRSQAGCANNLMLGSKVSSRRSDAHQMQPKLLHISYMVDPENTSPDFLSIVVIGTHGQRSRGTTPAASFGQQFAPRRRPSRTHFGRSAPARRGRAVHQGNPLAAAPARKPAQTASRIDPDGFSCSTCAHLGRFDRRFSRDLRRSGAAAAAAATPTPPRNDHFRRFRGGGTQVPPPFFEILGSKRWRCVWVPQTVDFWTKNIFCPNSGVLT